MAVLEKKQCHNYKMTRGHFNNGFFPPIKIPLCCRQDKPAT